MRVIRLLPVKRKPPIRPLRHNDYLDGIFDAYAVQQDGGILIGDFSLGFAH